MNFKINKDFDIQIYDDIMNIPVAPLLKCKDRRPNVTETWYELCYSEVSGVYQSGGSALEVSIYTVSPINVSL